MASKSKGTLKNPTPILDLHKKSVEEVTKLYKEDQKKDERYSTLLLNGLKITTLEATINLGASIFNHLKVLNLSGCSLSSINDSGPLPATLQRLHLDHNRLARLPACLSNLIDLQSLFAQNNQIDTVLNVEWAKLKNLSLINLQSNRLTTIPPAIASGKLTDLILIENPICSPLPFIVSKPPSILISYLKEALSASEIKVPSDDFIFSRKIKFTGKIEEKKDKKSKDRKTVKITKDVLKKETSRSSVNQDRSELVEIPYNEVLWFLNEFGSTEAQGRREYMEDRVICIPRMSQALPLTVPEEVANLFSKISFFGVYDGHGGYRAAEYLTKNMHKDICNSAAFRRGDFETAVKEGFIKCDNNLLEICRNKRWLDGTTSVVAMLIDNTLITGHAGDSRAVLCRDKKAVRLTEDHKPDRSDELKRVEEAGGEVVFRGNCFRVQGDLAMSRSLGDLRLKQPLRVVIPDPEIRVMEVTPTDEFIILASDGLWDVMSDQKACDLVRKCNTAQEASKKLVETALQLGTQDNTSAIVVRLNWFLDFITPEELEGNIQTDIPRGPAVTGHELKTLRGNKTRVVGVSSKHIFQQPTNPDQTIMLRVNIPSLNASKLLKFDITTNFEQVIEMICQKHRFPEPPEYWAIFCKARGEQPLLDQYSLQFYGIRDKEEIEMRKFDVPVKETLLKPDSGAESSLPVLDEEPIEQKSVLRSSRDNSENPPNDTTNNNHNDQSSNNDLTLNNDNISINLNNNNNDNEPTEQTSPRGNLGEGNATLKLKLPAIPLKPQLKSVLSQPVMPVHKPSDPTIAATSSNQNLATPLALASAQGTEGGAAERPVLQHSATQSQIEVSPRENDDETLAAFDPAEWREAKTPTGRLYYYNIKTRQTTWSLPNTK